ncbi:hypothetical protein L2E82_51742 [Cichorium intybus]|nr:hypothetical protein L2E82_51742 [Cichorium intybus]
MTPYRMAPPELAELRKQLHNEDATRLLHLVGSSVIKKKAFLVLSFFQRILGMYGKGERRNEETYKRERNKKKPATANSSNKLLCGHNTLLLL